MKPSRGRISLAEKIRKNAASLNLYAAAAGKSHAVPAIPPKRTTLRKPSTVPLEGDVQAAIIDYLKSRPDIGNIVRHNSGQAVEGERRVRYNIVYGKQDGEYMRMVDIECMRRGSGRKIAIEVKRPGWQRPTDQREREQAAYLAHVRECGGVGFFATSVDDVSRELGEL